MERSTSTRIQSAKKQIFIIHQHSFLIHHHVITYPASLHRGSAQTSALRAWGNAPKANNVRMASRNECNLNWAPIGCWSHGQGGCFMPPFQGNLRLRSMLEPLIFGSLCDLPVRPGRFSSIPISSYVCACATYLHCARMWCDYCHICGPRATQSPICAARPPKSLPSNAAFPKQQKTSCYHWQWNRPHSFNYSNLWLSEVVVNHIT